MADIAVQPFILKDVDLKVDLDNYEAHVSSVVITPNTTTPQQTWQGLTPAAKFTDFGTPDTQWVVTLNYAQDWTTVNSLSEYLVDNAGLEKTIVFQTKAGAAKKTWTVTVVIVPGPVGGDVNTFAVGTVTMPVKGTPVQGTSV